MCFKLAHNGPNKNVSIHLNSYWYNKSSTMRILQSKESTLGYQYLFDLGIFRSINVE